MTTIGIIGSGHVGSNLAKAAIVHGYDVVLSNSQGPETIVGLAGELGPKARAATPAEAAAAADFAIVAIPLPASGPFRARARSRILKLAQDGDLVVPMAETFKFADAPAAFAVLTSPHPPGKLALVNEH